MDIDALYLDLFDGGRPLYIPGSNEYKAWGMNFRQDLNAAGTLEFSIYIDHPEAQTILPRRTEVSIVRGDKARWTGYINKIKNSDPGVKTYECVGVLAYLNDSIQLPFNSGEMDEGAALRYLIENHNAQMVNCPWKKFVIGDIGYIGYAVGINIEEPQTTLQVIQKHLDYGVFLIDREINIPTLTFNHTGGLAIASNQPVEYGYNLIELEQEKDYTDIYTLIFPVGKKNDETGQFTTISSVNNGIPFIVDDDIAGKYPAAVQIVRFDDIDDAAELLRLSTALLPEFRAKAAPVIKVSASAFDMAFIDTNVQPLVLGGITSVVSEPHETNQRLECVSVSEEIGEPDSGRFKFQNL